VIKLDKIIFIFYLYIPSIGFVEKYLGLYGLILLFGFNIIIVALLRQYINEIYRKENQKYIVSIFFVFFIALIVLFIFVYPVANQKLPNYGNDQDDAINIAAQQLLNFQYPYSVKTYLNNPISPFPGAIILGIPFVLLGTSAFQNIFWFVILGYIYIKEFGIKGLSHLLMLFLLSPVMFYLFFVGSDYLSNSIYILFALWLIKEKILNKKKYTSKHFLILIFAGLTFSSRLNFLFILPIFFGFLIKNSSVKSSIIIVSSIFVSFLLITLPFYFYNTDGFSPLHTMEKLSRFNDLLPQLDILIILFTIALSIYFAFKRIKNFNKCLEYSSYVLSFPVIITSILLLIQSSDSDLIYTYFGVHYLIFAYHPVIDKILV
jgi:hypothetical protein